MSQSGPALQRQIAIAGDLRSVVRTMRALAASSISRYEAAVLALGDYLGAVEQALGLCLRQVAPSILPAPVATQPKRRAAIVFGSDHGLVGPFNEVVTEYARRTLDLERAHEPPLLWAVGELAASRLADAGLSVSRVHAVPASADAIGDLVDRLLIDLGSLNPALDATPLHVFFNQPRPGAAYEPVGQRLLPLDRAWQARLASRAWPGTAVPEVLGDGTATLLALLREYLFISLFQASAESLASENASRLAAMQRADRNIGDLLDSLRAQVDRQRQAAIDTELFDVVAGYESLGLAG